MLRGLGFGTIRALISVGNPYSVEVGKKSTLASSESEDDSLLPPCQVICFIFFTLPNLAL